MDKTILGDNQARPGAGELGYGWNDLADCLESLKLSNGQFACSFIGSGAYSVFSIARNRLMGINDHGLEEDDCGNTIAASRRGLVCNWQGTGFSIYQLPAGNRYGNLNFDTVANCQQFVQARNDTPALTPDDAPIKNLLVPYERKVDSALGFTFKKCVDHRQGDRMVRTDSHGQLLPECVPDTLYSWRLCKIEMVYRQSSGSRAVGR